MGDEPAYEARARSMRRVAAGETGPQRWMKPTEATWVGSKGLISSRSSPVTTGR